MDADDILVLSPPTPAPRPLGVSGDDDDGDDALFTLFNGGAYFSSSSPLPPPPQWVDDEDAFVTFSSNGTSRPLLPTPLPQSPPSQPPPPLPHDYGGLDVLAFILEAASRKFTEVYLRELDGGSERRRAKCDFMRACCIGDVQRVITLLKEYPFLAQGGRFAPASVYPAGVAEVDGPHVLIERHAFGSTGRISLLGASGASVAALFGRVEVCLALAAFSCNAFALPASAEGSPWSMALRTKSLDAARWDAYLSGRRDIPYASLYLSARAHLFAVAACRILWQVHRQKGTELFPELAVAACAKHLVKHVYTAMRSMALAPDAFYPREIAPNPFRDAHAVHMLSTLLNMSSKRSRRLFTTCKQGAMLAFLDVGRHTPRGALRAESLDHAVFYNSKLYTSWNVCGRQEPLASEEEEEEEEEVVPTEEAAYEAVSPVAPSDLSQPSPSSTTTTTTSLSGGSCGATAPQLSAGESLPERSALNEQAINETAPVASSEQRVTFIPVVLSETRTGSSTTKRIRVERREMTLIAGGRSHII